VKEYKSHVSHGAKRKKCTPGKSDPAYKEAMGITKPKEKNQKS